MTRSFLDITMKCKEETYPSTGHGTDHRFEGRSVVGSALVYENTVINMAFFTTTEAEKTGQMSGLRSRRGYRVHLELMGEGETSDWERGDEGKGKWLTG